ncbi:uncharacterized protein G2W53_040236 [Senna tora]|uniref:Uncharacterized protein n=1 Tax=Senna tora TaxID=362788 RepID=A0A834SP35_9FABA|nr:uncharacterized protein G2W53_040236 [Senna tora]
MYHDKKRVVGQLSQTDRFTLYLGIREDVMLELGSRSRGRISKELKKFKFKLVVAQVSKKDRFALYLAIRVALMLEWGS